MDAQAKIDRFKSLKAKMPSSELPRWSLAQAYEEAGDKEAAAAEYRDLVALKPEYCMAFVRLGAVALGLGLFEESRSALEKAIALARAQGHEAPRMEAMGLLEDLEEAEEDA